MISLDLTKPMNTEEGLIYLCVVGATDNEYSSFLEHLNLKEGYGVIRLDNMEQVDDNSFGIPSSILTSDKVTISSLPKCGAPIITYQSIGSTLENPNYLMINDENHLEDAIEQFVEVALSTRRKELYTKYSKDIEEVLSADEIDVERVIDLMARKDEVALGHIKSVAELGLVLLDGMEETGLADELTDQEKKDFPTVALIHDLGKLTTPDQLLKNSDKLSFKEYTEMKHHVDVNLELAKNEKSRELIALATKHHYRYDGKGYGGQSPDEVGELIPLQDRMLAVIDAFDAIVDPGRTYQGNDGTSKLEKAVNIVYANSHEKSEEFKGGGQFDPKVAYAFLVGFSNKFKNDSEFRDKWLEKEGMSFDAESKVERIDKITTLLENTINKFEEENKKTTASQI